MSIKFKVLKFFSFFVCLSSCQTATLLVTEHEKKSILSYCQIFNISGELIRNYSGQFCVPFSNGDLAVATENKLMLLDRNNKKIWTKEIPAHHQIKASKDEKRLLVLASRYQKISKKTQERFDQLLVIRKDGKIEAHIELNEKTVPGFAKIPYRKDEWSSARDLNIETLERTHVNAINERKDQPGYLISNLFPSNVYFFDEALKGIVKNIELKEIIHDVSMISSSEIMFYQNRIPPKEDRSRITVLNIATGEKKYIYGESQIFFSDARGSAQDLGNNQIIISHSPTGKQGYVQIVNTKNGKEKTIQLKFLPTQSIQTATLADLTEFLEKNRGN